MDWPRAALLLTMSLYRVLGGESELLVGNSFVAPFNESEQFGLHVQTTKLLSKPVSPIGWLCWWSVYGVRAPTFPVSTRRGGLLHSLALAAERTLDLPLHVFLGYRLALVAFLAAATEGEFDLDPAVHQFEGKRHEG